MLNAARKKRLHPFTLALSAVALCSAQAIKASESSSSAVDDLTEVSFEQLVSTEVVSASKLARQISDSPSAVAIVTSEDIRAFGYRTLAEVINSMRGLYTTYDRQYSYMGGRGFGKPGDYVGRVMLMIDGYPTQDNLYNQAYIDESGLLDLAVIERVEYVPGTGSVTYGNNAMLGIINVVTKKGADFGTAQLSGELFSKDGIRRRMTYGKQFENGTDVLLSVSGMNSAGNSSLYFPGYDTPVDNNGIANNKDSESNRRFFGKFGQGGFSLEAAFVERKKMVPTSPVATGGSKTQFNGLYQAWDENSFINAKYETELNLQTRSVTSLYNGRYADHSRRQYDANVITDNEMYRRNNSQGQWWGWDQKFITTALRGHTTILGIEVRNDYAQRMVREYLLPDNSVNSRSIKNFRHSTTSLYITDEFLLAPAVTLNLGLRQDMPSTLKSNLSPRLAVIYTPTPSTTLKASYSEAFRVPNANDQSYFGKDTIAEHVSATELVVQHQLTPQAQLTGSVYHYDLTQQTYLGANDAILNNGKGYTDGVEFEAEQRWDSGARFKGSVSWQQAMDIDGRALINAPKHLAKANYSHPLNSWTRLGVELQYLGSRLTSTRRELDAVTLANLTLSSERKWYGFSGALSVKNVTNQKYEAVAPYVRTNASTGYVQDTLRMDGRSFWLQVNYDL